MTETEKYKLHCFIDELVHTVFARNEAITFEELVQIAHDATFALLMTYYNGLSRGEAFCLEFSGEAATYFMSLKGRMFDFAARAERSLQA